MRNLTLMIFTALIAACGGGDGGSSTYTPPPPQDNTVKVNGKAVSLYVSGATKQHADTKQYYQHVAKQSVDLPTLLDECVGDYLDLFDSLTPNVDGTVQTLNKTRTAFSETYIALNVDMDSDLLADLNVEVSDVPDMPFLTHINFDTTCDGQADINVDTDGDGVPELNIDEDVDGIADYGIIDASAKAVANADVTLTSVPEGTPVYETTTDTNGDFNVNELTTGEYHMEIVSNSGTGGTKSGKQTGPVIWTRAALVVNSDSDLGVYALDAGPYLDAVFINGVDVNDTDPASRNYGSREDGAGFQGPFETGQTYTFDVYIIDPNASPITAVYRTYNEAISNFDNILVEGESVTGEPNQKKFTVSITLHDNYYTVSFGDYSENYLPETINGVSTGVLYPSCTRHLLSTCDAGDTPVFDWSSVSTIGFIFSASNTDGIGVLDGQQDLTVGVRLNNTAYAPTEPDVPDLNSITVNGVVYNNTAAPGDEFIIDVGDVTGNATVELSADVTADEPYPIYYRWYVNGNSYIGQSISIPVADLPKSYATENSRILLYLQYRDENTIYQYAYIRASIEYDVDGSAQPASCDGVNINGSTDVSNILFFVGDVLAITPIISDPKGLPTEYAIYKSGNRDVEFADSWLTGYVGNEPTYVANGVQTTYTLTEEDAVDNFRLNILCRNNDGFGRDGANSTDSSIFVPLEISE